MSFKNQITFQEWLGQKVINQMAVIWHKCLYKCVYVSLCLIPHCTKQERTNISKIKDYRWF